MKKISLLFLMTISYFCFSQNKPNILIIQVDDLGFHDLSSNGSVFYNTPNIDKLAKESAIFQNAYANYPRCVPSRYSLLSSKYPPLKENSGKFADITSESNFLFHFNKAGYQTAFIGKWHQKKSPLDFGFQYSYAAGKAGATSSFFFPFNQGSYKINDGGDERDPIENVDEDAKKGDYLTDVLTNKSIDYIENRDKSKPFYLSLSFYAVHEPLEGKEIDVNRNKEQLLNINFKNQPEYIKEGNGVTKMYQDNPVYAAMVENTDENIGKIIEYLKSKKLLDNTIIVFTSDHGGLSNNGSTAVRDLATTNSPLRAGKGWLYEGGIKVPLFIYWKNKIKPFQDNESIILQMDLLPTLVELVTKSKMKNVDGKSFVNVINKKESWKTREVYWNMTMARPKKTGENNASAIRSGDWKLMHFYETNQVELYNIKNDTSEKNNLAIENKEKTTALLNKLNAWKNTIKKE